MRTTRDYDIIKTVCGYCEREQDDDHYFYLCNREDDLCKKDRCPLTKIGLRVQNWVVGE